MITEMMGINPEPVFVDKVLPKVPQENERGNIEYKYKLNYQESDFIFKKRRKKEERKKEKIASQMLYRLLEGEGKAVYIIGVHDNGDNIGIELSEIYDSIRYFVDCVEIIKAKIKSIKIYRGRIGYITTIRLGLDIDLNYNLFII